MNLKQIKNLAQVVTHDSEMMAILRGGEGNVECEFQKTVSESTESHSKEKKEMVGELNVGESASQI